MKPRTPSVTVYHVYQRLAVQQNQMQGGKCVKRGELTIFTYILIKHAFSWPTNGFVDDVKRKEEKTTTLEGVNLRVGV